MQILLLGCGYTGSAIAKELIAHGHTVFATTTTPSKFAALEKIGIHPHIYRVGDDLKPLLHNIDIVILTIANRDYQTYVTLATSLVDILPLFPNIKQLIYTSSTSVYGEHGGKKVTENTPLEAANQLLQTEEILLKFPNTLIYRLGEIIGPEREPESRLTTLPFPGDGSSTTNLSHIDDIAKAIRFGIEKQLFGIYNLVNDLHISRKLYWTTLAKKYNLPQPLWNGLPSRFTSNKLVDNAKIKDTGYKFSFPYYPMDELSHES